MKKLTIFAIALVLATSAFTFAAPAPTASSQDMVSMVKKGSHKVKRGTKYVYHVTKNGTKVVYYRTKKGGKWVYSKGKAGTKTGYYKVKRGGKWVYERAL